MAWRAKMLLGHWPQYVIDKPDRIGQNDKIFQSLLDMTWLAIGFAGWSVFLWIGFFVAWYNKYTTRQRKIMVWTFIIVWMIALAAANNLAWYMNF